VPGSLTDHRAPREAGLGFFDADLASGAHHWDARNREIWEGCIIVCDGEEDPGEVSHIGDRWVDDDAVENVLAGDEAAGCTLLADRWGLWIRGIAPIRTAGGEVVAAVAADIPALEIGGLSLDGDPSGGYSAVLRAAGLGRRAAPPVKRGDGVQCPDASGEVQPVTLSQSSGRSSG
jgi:hypothetical protein